MKNDDMQLAQGTEVTFVIPTTEEIGRLTSMNKKFNLVIKYKSADEWAAILNKPIRCFYKGVKEIPNKEGDLISCAAFVSETECFLSGQKVLMDAVLQLPVNAPIEITYVGKKQNKNSDGATMQFEVVTLED